MIDLAANLIGWLTVAVMALVTLLQLGWQSFRFLTSSLFVRVNAGAIVVLTVLALAPPHDYQALDRMIICAALLIIPCVIALFTDPRLWKLLQAGHILSAAAWVYVCIQAAR